MPSSFCRLDCNQCLPDCQQCHPELVKGCAKK